MKLLPSHHTTMHYVTSCEGACVFSCNLPPAPLEKWPRSFKSLSATAVTRGWNGCTKVRVSTESWPWRRKFSCRSCRDSDLWPFSHEFSTQTTELSQLPPWAVPLCVDFESMLAKICAFCRLSRKNKAHLTVIEQHRFCWCWKGLWSQLCSCIQMVSSYGLAHFCFTQQNNKSMPQKHSLFLHCFPMFDGCHTHLKCDNAYICICRPTWYLCLWQ